MHDRLREILASKRSEAELLRPRLPELRRVALARNEFRSLARALERRPDASLAVIAEVKQASPSLGSIADAASFDPAVIARAYAEGGADAISVLTDGPFFGGRLEHVGEARRAAGALPVLRKEFIVDEAQVFEAGAAGADAILLIVAALSDDDLQRFMDIAAACQLDVLTEVHTLDEMERALEAGASLIGINNRDLSTFRTDLGVTEELAEEAPTDVTLVSESGIFTAADARRARDAGADALLVGEALMRCPPDRVAAKIRELKLLPAGIPLNGGGEDGQ